ncbi:PTS fructose transporter subunit IIC [Haloarcula nitratireducens]|uniref:PTS fructose transporter subunit IIC n=1 Tax=Haloarcula nitratireducens TaxID=2487749 RepID=A0AAW4PHG1_9EURY|nr:PTS fructose transporter subunit IIC [Halomicroarcula nitratireducens]MBX0297018.1 PTS fructose transporter subunit IIC [Halomicroarcula nitratireducens]
MSKELLEGALRKYLTSIREDLMTGVSYMVPFVTTGGLLLAMAFAYATFFGDGTVSVFETTGSIGWFLAQLGTAGLTLMVPVLGAYVAYSIADRPAIAPGFILSYIIQQGTVLEVAGEAIGFPTATAQAGYLGALAVGLLVGYVVSYIRSLAVPDALKPMMPVLILPAGTVLLLFPVVLFCIGVPGAIVNQWLQRSLIDIQGGQAVVVGMLLGAMMAFDMGGPVNKVAYLFAFDLLRAGIYEPMAAVMIAGMTPPIGMAIATVVAPHKYPDTMYENAKSGVILGLSFITEGAIPYAAADPLRVIPALVTGSSVAAGLSMVVGLTMRAPHGGLFVVPLSNAPAAFVGITLLGSLITAVTVTLIKPDPNCDEEAGSEVSSIRAMRN